MNNISPSLPINSTSSYKPKSKSFINQNKADIVLFRGASESKYSKQSAGELSAQRSQLLNVISNIKANKVKCNIDSIETQVNSTLTSKQQLTSISEGETKGFDFLYSPDKKALTLSEEAVDSVSRTSTNAAKAIKIANQLNNDVKKIFAATADKLNLNKEHQPEVAFTYLDSRILAYNGGDKLIINTLFLEKARNPILLSSILLAHELSHKKSSVMLGLVDSNNLPKEYRPSTPKQPDEIEGMSYIRDTVSKFSKNSTFSEQAKEEFRNSADYKMAVNFYTEFLDGLKDYYVEYEDYEKTPCDKVRADIIKLLDLNNRDLLPISVEDLYEAKSMPDIKYDRLLIPAFTKNEISEIEGKISEKMPQIKQLLSEYDTKELSESSKKFYKVYSDHIDERISRYNEIKIIQENIKDRTIVINDDALIEEFMALKPDETLNKDLIKLHRSQL